MQNFIRYLINDICIVELVRKYYGFEAENLEESNRIKQTLLSQNLGKLFYRDIRTYQCFYA